MLLGGLWHGAAWNFVLWGAWHGAGLMLNRCWQEHSGLSGRLPAGLARLATFLFVLYGWLLFRSGSFAQIGSLTGALMHWTAPAWLMHYAINLVLLLLPLAFMEAWLRKSNNMLAPLNTPAWVRNGLQGLLLLGILLFWEKHSVPFIYFQF
jgi:alginate O-acetyltransferase complex protein AlgI